MSTLRAPRAPLGIIQKDKVFMRIQDLIEEYIKSNQSGIFELKKDEIINDIIKENKVPNSYGIYIIYSIKNLSKNIIYIGKSGTMRNDGTFRNQGIAERLTKKQDGILRKIYFQNIIKKFEFEKLEFLWITTFDKKYQEIPSLSEAKNDTNIF